MKKVVLMSMENARLEISPARYQLLDELDERGFETYVFLPDSLKKRESYSSIHHIVNVQSMSIRDIRNKIMSISPQVLIASTYEDMDVVYILPWMMKKTCFYYYNLEIYTPYLHRDILKKTPSIYMNYKLKYPSNKLREVLYTRKVKAFTIQDNLRKKLSAKYFIRHHNTILIPNSYVLDQTKIVHGKQAGVIYAGGIKREFLIEQFKDLKTVTDVPITFSGQMIDDWCKREIKRLKKSNPNFTFIEQNLPPDEYTRYLQNFAVGLVWYSPRRKDKAHYYMGLSSGRMFKFLSMGMPIIAVKCPGITEEVRRYKLGIVVDNISEVGKAYDEIMRNYEYYQNCVIRTYRLKYDFKKTVAPFLDYVERELTRG